MRFWLEINGEEFPGTIEGTIKRELGRDCICTVCDDSSYWNDVKNELPNVGDYVLVKYNAPGNPVYDAIKVVNSHMVNWVANHASHWVKIKTPE